MGVGFELDEEKRKKHDVPEHQPTVFLDPPDDVAALFDLVRHGKQVVSPMKSSRYTAVDTGGKSIIWIYLKSVYLNKKKLWGMREETFEKTEAEKEPRWKTSTLEVPKRRKGKTPPRGRGAFLRPV